MRTNTIQATEYPVHDKKCPSVLFEEARSFRALTLFNAHTVYKNKRGAKYESSIMSLFWLIWGFSQAGGCARG
jgi:hypothetical protein